MLFRSRVDLRDVPSSTTLEGEMLMRKIQQVNTRGKNAMILRRSVNDVSMPFAPYTKERDHMGKLIDLSISQPNMFLEPQEAFSPISETPGKFRRRQLLQLQGQKLQNHIQHQIFESHNSRKLMAKDISAYLGT